MANLRDFILKIWGIQKKRNKKNSGLSKDLVYRIYTYRDTIFNLIYRGQREYFTDNILLSLYWDTIKEKISSEEPDRLYNTLKHITDVYFDLERYFFKGGEKVQVKDCKEIKTDKEFAYIAGQVVYYILSQSEASNKTHALLEPFINLKNWDLFKLRIIEIFEKYKHKISFNNERFNRCLSSILNYSPEEKNFGKLKIYFLSGYLDDNLFYMRKEENNGQYSK